jgi:hypothetical protein
MNDVRLRRQRLVMRYRDALDDGDPEGMAEVWAEAETDEVLEAMLLEAGEGAAQEDGPAEGWSQDAAAVEAALRLHLPAAMNPPDPPADPPPPTAGEVAARIESDPALHGRLSAAERLAGRRLLGDPTPLPAQLGGPAMEAWFAGLPAAVGPGYRAVFRQAAVLTTLARGRQASALAAARRTRPGSRPEGGGRS